MDCYEIWVDLAAGVKDTEFVQAVEGWLGHLQSAGTIEKFRIKRRKLGFGPPELGEFYISIEFTGLTQLDDAFRIAAAHDPDVDRLHAAVWSRVVNYKSGLYRDFPDMF